MNKSTGLTYVLQGSSLNPELINILLFFLNGYSFPCLYLSHYLFSDKVLDFDGLVSIGNIGHDWEMLVGQSHSEFKASGDTSDHIFNMRSYRGNRAFLFSGPEPHFLNFLL